MELCPVTGKSECHCEKKLAATKEGQLLLVNLKEVLRVLFTDHAIYTANLIQENLPTLSPAADAMTTRVLRNPKDISNLLSKIIGPNLAKDIENLFTEHLKLAAGAIKVLREGTPTELNNAINKLYENGDQVASALHTINRVRIPLEEVQQMMKTHNIFVLELASLRKQGRWEEYIKKYDAYYAHILKLSDAIYHGLATPF
jgi:hypothetical protein